MMQGDQYKLPIELKHADGTSVSFEEIKDLEVFVGNTRKTLGNGISYVLPEGVFEVSLTQEETFRMIGQTKVQARVVFRSGDVVGVNLGSINFEQATSKVVLK